MQPQLTKRQLYFSTYAFELQYTTIHSSQNMY